MSNAANFPPPDPINKSNQFQVGFFQGVQTSQVGTAASLAASNIVLLQGQIGYESDTGYFKIGDGVTKYNSLSYQPQIGKVQPAGNYAPSPQTGAVVGQWQSMYSVNVNLVLPAGGTWAWMCIGAFATATGLYVAYPTSGISAGGTTIWTNSGTQTVVGLVWRIA